jgi:hypothetical protein
MLDSHTQRGDNPYRSNSAVRKLWDIVAEQGPITGDDIVRHAENVNVNVEIVRKWLRKATTDGIISVRDGLYSIAKDKPSMEDVFNNLAEELDSVATKMIGFAKQLTDMTNTGFKKSMLESMSVDDLLDEVRRRSRTD